MRLTELEPQWLQFIGERTFRRDEGLTAEAADGIMFLCPKCFKQNGGPMGTNSIICWTPKVPKSVSPQPGRWSFEGQTFGDLTLVAGSSSVALIGGCAAHFFIRNGEIVEA